jgi:hypothetical protein
MSSRPPGGYQPSRTGLGDDAYGEEELETVNAQRYRDDDDSVLLNPSKAKYPAGPPPSYSASRIFSARRLSKSCIAVAVLILALVLSIIGGGGYYIYQTEIINGQSPPWYPSPLGGTVPSWQDSYTKAQKMVEKMTLVEKVNITTGTGWAMGESALMS